MNLNYTKFTVDKCTPRDRFARVTQISFPTSIRTSIDDFYLDSPLTPFFPPTGEFFTRPRAHSDTSKEPEWQIHDPSLAYLFPEGRYDHPDPPRSPTPIDFFLPPTPPMPADTDIIVSPLNPLPSPTLTQDPSSPTLPEPVPVTPVDPDPIWIFDSSLREVDFDVTCLSALDEQLLHSPKDCFLDVCWAEAVYDEVEVPVMEPALAEKLWAIQSQSERRDELLQRRLDPIMTRVQRKPSPLSSSPQSYTALCPKRTLLEESESRMLYQNANNSVHFFPVPQQRDSRPRPHESHVAEDPPDTRSRKTSGKLKLFSDTYDTLTGWRRTASHA
ncbi:hypothetical protein AZE42_06516 [Rhizopogon vesiculosus]|uniref:Uncharacterized protein n=1 Tax=Rhizopogon vesiculosus TaxID=180088 RepID=A0A1J8QGH5_9AGAM|nr:hypothetical protein AZE42_06516 [Rhizopogon vesiculosus]